MKKIGLLLAILIVVIGGCTSARISSQLSAGVMPCRAEDIIITEETADFSGMHNWVAECDGKKYVCNYHQSSGVNCVELNQ